jgi:hypothetical protein
MKNINMSETIDLIEPVSQLGKRRSLRSELFINNLFEEKDLPSEHKSAKTHREVKCLNCP